MEKTIPGKTFLLVTGIISTIWGVGSALIGASSISSIALLNGDSPTAVTMRQVMAESGTTQADIMRSGVIAIIMGILYLFVGIIGIMFSKKVQKAQICFIAALITIAAILINAVISAVTGSYNVVLVVISLVVPLFYLWGAMQNKQAAEIKAS